MSRGHVRVPSFVVSVHDVTAASAAACLAWVRELDNRRVPSTLLVVPRPSDSVPSLRCRGLVTWLHERVSLGDEVALHGYSHRASPFAPRWRRLTSAALARGCAEFWTIDRLEASRRLRAGRWELKDAGFDPRGFTPPGWLTSAACLRAVADAGFAYTTTHAAVLDLTTERRHRAVALSQRPGGRGERFGVWLMPHAASALLASHGRVRVALHPADLEHPALRRSALATIDALLSAGARPTTYARLVDDERQRPGHRVEADPTLGDSPAGRRQVR